jgi:ligand-binding sensor domain-containing protein
MWVGTEAGLARFDGLRFVVFRTATTPELAHNLIRYLFEDRAGWLWIGTQRGVSRMRTESSNSSVSRRRRSRPSPRTRAAASG